VLGVSIEDIRSRRPFKTGISLSSSVCSFELHAEKMADQRKRAERFPPAVNPYLRWTAGCTRKKIPQLRGGQRAEKPMPTQGDF
jgi:hypothetical protein